MSGVLLARLAMAPPIGLRGTGQPQRSSVAGRTRLLDPCRTCREADRQATGAVVLLSEVADHDSAEAISPALVPGAFPNTPPRAWGPAATSTELTGPVAEGGTGPSKQDPNPPQGAYARKGPRSRAGCPHHVEPHVVNITHGRSGIPRTEKWPSIGIIAVVLQSEH